MPEEKVKVILLQYTSYPEEVIAQAAKLCYSQTSIWDLQKLISYDAQTDFIKNLADRGHFSPFEHVSFTFGVEGISRACSHQIVRHRIASYSQQSQRYVSEKNFDFIIPESFNSQWLFKDATNKDAYVCGKEWFSSIMGMIQQWYNEAIKRGIPKEDARFLLPNATETKIIITMNVRELLHFFNVRCCNRAQWEIRAMAIEMLRLSKSVAPNIFKMAGPRCISGECSEGKMSCGKMDEVRIRFQS